MTGKEIYKTLTDDEKCRFKINFHSDKVGNGFSYSETVQLWEDYKNTEFFHNTHSFIMHGFCWGDTVEGSDYWARLCERCGEIKPIKPNLYLGSWHINKKFTEHEENN